MFKKSLLICLSVFGVVLFCISDTCFGNQCPELAGNDNIVNLTDFSVLASNWEQTGAGLSGDFDYSGTVDIVDLAYFVDYWLTDGNCADYFVDELPYLTSFENYQQWVHQKIVAHYV